MLATAEAVRADELNGALDVVPVPAPLKTAGPDVAGAEQEALESRVSAVVSQFAERTAAQPSALGKWAYWTQVGISGLHTSRGGDGYEDAVNFTGRIMALHSQAEDAKEGIDAFLSKRTPSWRT
jgi:enoyl-CoA hydratase/carnithine racemase